MTQVDIDLTPTPATVGPPPSVAIGVPGIQGAKGDTGNTGAQGPQGNTGAQGAKGDPGDQAPASLLSTSGNIPLSDTGPATKTRILTGNTTITALGAPSSSVSFTATYVWKQAASGGPYTLTWPATLEWPNDAPAPAMPTAANAECMVHLFWTGQAWRGLYGGAFYP